MEKKWDPNRWCCSREKSKGFFYTAPKCIFKIFKKHFLLDIFIKFWNSDLKISDKLSFCLNNEWQKSEEQLRKQYSTRTDLVSLLLEILLGSFNQFYGFILFLNSWIFQIQFEEHLRMKYFFRILDLSWKNL